MGGVAGYFGRCQGGELKYACKDMGQVEKSCPGLNGEACILKKYLDRSILPLVRVSYPKNSTGFQSATGFFVYIVLINERLCVGDAKAPGKPVEALGTLRALFVFMAPGR